MNIITRARRGPSPIYRTIKGQQYEAHLSFPADQRIADYRKAGIRCRRFKHELFVHVMDIDAARDIDRAAERYFR